MKGRNHEVIGPKSKHVAYLFLAYAAIGFVLGVLQIPLAIADEKPVILLKEGNNECNACVNYEVRIYKNGRVVYEGTVLYRDWGSITLTIKTGVRETMVSPAQVETWTDMLLSANFLSLSVEDFKLGPCPVGRHDVSMTFSMDERVNTLSGFHCLNGSFPREIHKVKWDLRNIIDKEQWIKKRSFNQ